MSNLFKTDLVVWLVVFHCWYLFVVSRGTGCVFCAHRHFLGMNLCDLNSNMSRHMQEVLKAEMPQNQKDWKEDGLFNLTYSFLFK